MGRFSSRRSSKPTFYTGGGAWRRPVDIIYKTQAMKQYGLTEDDLDELTPLSEEVNWRNSRQTVVIYNEAKVKKLAWNIQQQKEIMRSKAQKEYGLSASDLDRLKPCRTQPNPHENARGPTRFYNRADVEALVKELARERDIARAAIAQDQAACKAAAAAAKKVDEEEQYWDAFDDEETLALADSSGLF
uniref:Uncharacterized protein n=1 Tax=Mycena chlorophos TaxID=658473 RepID=A0ABQ0LIU0_MYCCL|nr:predicted protein [Mycena chlorophos]